MCFHSNVEDVVHFPGLPPRRQLTYQVKQLIARETELERMRKMEKAQQKRNPHKVKFTQPVHKYAHLKSELNLLYDGFFSERFDYRCTRLIFCGVGLTDLYNMDTRPQ